MSDDTSIFTLDDFSVTQEYLADAKKFTRLAVKKDYEVPIDVEDFDVLQNDLVNNSQDPNISRHARAIMETYRRYDKNVNLLDQDNYVRDYLQGNYHLRWLLPVVSDLKQVYKKELEKIVGNKLTSKEELTQTVKIIMNFDRNPRSPAEVIQALSNYLTLTPEERQMIESKNPLGSNVLRLGAKQLNGLSNEIRGSHGDVISHEYLYKTRGKGEGRLITGKESFVQVPSEKLKVIGFSKIPSARMINEQIKWGLKTAVTLFPKKKSGEDGDSVSPDNIRDTLRLYLPTVEQLLNTYNTSNIIQFRTLMYLFEFYGHTLQNLTASNRKQINFILTQNIDMLKPLTYQVRQRKYISFLEEQFSKYDSPILTKKILSSDAIDEYQLIRDPLLSTHFMIYHEIMKQRDNGGIWLTMIANQSLTMAQKKTFKLSKIVNAPLQQYKCPNETQFRGLVLLPPGASEITPQNHFQVCIWDSSQGKYISKKDYLEKTIEQPKLFTPDLRFDSKNVDRAVLRFKVQKQFVFNHHRLLNSYYNLLGKTQHNPELLARLANPLDNLFGLRPDKRDQIAWFNYFKKGVPDRLNRNYSFKGQWIGCQHEYDRLYQKFVDNQDSYPLNKRYTTVLPFNGVVCSFCGETLREQDDLTEQGFDQFGRRVQITSGNLTGIDSSIRDFFVNKDENLTWASKTVDKWNEATREIPGGGDSKEIQNAQKYNILRRYQTFTSDNVFVPGLVLDPNLMPLKDNKIMEFLTTRLKLDVKKSTPMEAFLLQYLLTLFKTMDKTYELLIQRLAVLMVSLQYYLVQKDGVTYLNPDVLLGTILGNLSMIGQMFLNLKFNPKFSSEIKNMGIRNLGMAAGDKDRTFPKFYQTFHRFYQSHPANKKLSAQQIDAKIKDDYLKFVQKFFYNQNVDGPLFNGNFPYEHEIIRIYNDYLDFEGKGKVGIQALLKSSFLKYYTQFVESDKQVSKMIDQIREDVIKISGMDYLLEFVSPKNGILYQKYLGQQHWFLQQQLELAYLDLINEAVYLMGDSVVRRNQIGEMSINTKRHYYLGKMMCESWSKLRDLNISGADSFTLILDKITKIKIKISALPLPSLRLIWTFVGLGLRPNNRPDPYTIIKTGFVPPTFKAPMNKSVIFKGNVGYDANESKGIKLPSKEEQNLNQFLNELKFVPRIKEILEKMGTIGYLPDLKKAVAEIRNIVEKRGIDVQVCSQDPVSNPHKGVNELVDENEFAGDRIRMLNLKKYIISQLRFYMELFTRINRDQLKRYGLQYKYTTLMKNNEFNDTFMNFKTELTSNQLIDYINVNLDNPKNWRTVNNVLLYTLVHDISRHLRTLRLDATKFVKKKTGPSKGMSKYDIYQQFVKNLFEEIEFNQKVNDVPFNHRQINQALFGKMIAEAQSQVKGGKDALEWGIIKFKLSVRETEDAREGSGPNLDQDVITSPDTNVEDALEMDFDLGDDGNDYSD